MFGGERDQPEDSGGCVEKLCVGEDKEGDCGSYA